jgi:hypothetical protein
MKDLFYKIKTELRQNMVKVILFSYALILGTTLPLTLSRCTANCSSCGSCALYLGIIPVIAAVALRKKIRHGWESLANAFSRSPKIR